VNQQAILVFADATGVDLARRRLPKAVDALLRVRREELSRVCGADVHFFSNSARCDHRQTGATFAERFENAVEALHALGYSEIVAIGSDCPQLQMRDIDAAFEELKSKRLVLGPDHRGGCYLIGFHANDRRVLRGVRWNNNVDCEQLQSRCGFGEVALLAPKHDLDSIADLPLIARDDDRLARLVRFVLRRMPATRAATEFFVSLSARRLRARWQLPPPLAA
jgi:hypothetical protein